MIKIFFLLTVFLFSLSCFAGGGGGATSIGDGGFVVVCPKTVVKRRSHYTVHLLDTYDARVHKRPHKITLGAGDFAPQVGVNTGLHRIKKRFHLNQEQFHLLENISAVLIKNQFDPWLKFTSTSRLRSFLSANTGDVSKKTLSAISYDRCYLDVAILRYSNEKTFVPEVNTLCKYSPGSSELCFLTNLPLYTRLSSNEKACLIIHELLRYLPTGKQPKTDQQLRRWTAEICTE